MYEISVKANFTLSMISFSFFFDDSKQYTSSFPYLIPLGGFVGGGGSMQTELILNFSVNL